MRCNQVTISNEILEALKECGDSENFAYIYKRPVRTEQSPSEKAVPSTVGYAHKGMSKELRNQFNLIAGKYADVNKSQYYSLKLISINSSVFLDGYWDACFKVFNDCGNEIEGPLLIAISGETGQIYSMEELIMNNSENQNVKISNESVNSK